MSEIIYAQERNVQIQFEELRKAAPHRCIGGWSCESHVMEPMGHEIDGVECGDMRGQQLGQLQRADAGGTGQAQWQVGGEVAMFGVPRPLHLNIGHRLKLQHAFLPGGFQGLCH